MLTPAQQQALDLHAHTAIIANAGSGKTKVLVEKYLSILLEHPGYHPRDLVAITFTEQAARDLKRKILEEIERRLGLDEAAGSTKQRLNEIRFLLGSAQISTIHAFCNQLLRSYPVEANVDASFGILFPPEDRIVLDEAIRAVFYRVLEAAYKDESSSEARFLPLFRALGRGTASDAMHSMMERRAMAIEVVNIVAGLSNQELLARWNASVLDYLEHEFFAHIDVQWYVDQLARAKSSSQRVQTARLALTAFLGARTLKAKVGHAIELLDAFHTRDWDRIASGMVSKNDQEDLEREIAPRLADLDRASSVAKAFVDENVTDEFEQSYVQLMRLLVELFTYVLEEYEHAKSAHGLIDHDDSLLKTLALTEIPEIAAELAERYKYILVDEYQDTDPVQYQIIEKITQKLQAPNTLTIVGDPKQSIYSFRNAELQLFFDTVAQIRTSRRSKLVDLQENFRLLPAPLAFINTVFDFIFKLKSSSIETPENLPLVQARTTDSSGRVEFLLTGEAGNQLTAEDLIARKINELVSSGYEIDDQGTRRPAQYRDIAILQRSRARQKEIEKALFAHEIPFSIYSGTGYYSRQEIVDIVSYLQFLLDQTDDVALAGTLRSPYFAFEDSDLLKIAVKRTYDDKTFWHIFSRLAAADDAPSRWQRAYRQLAENCALAGRISAYQLINKIYEESRIFGIYEQLRSGRQTIANLEKFASLALVGESSPYFGTYDFVERILLLSERDDQEAQAELRDDEDTVRIMTIHAAKGLEFPIVILPQLDRDLGKKDSRRADVFLDTTLGAVMPFRDLDYQHWAYKLVRQGYRERELEEEKRIFYVGATRARDYLLLSGSLEEKKLPRNSYLGWIEQALGIELRGRETLRKVVRIGVYENESVYQDDIVLTIPVTRDIQVVSPDQQERRAAKHLPTSNLQVLPESESQSRYSPTQLLHYIECPTKYYLRYGLGLPEESYRSTGSEAADLAEFIKGNLLGQLVHYALEKLDSYRTNDSIDRQQFDTILREGLERLEIYDPTAFTKYHDTVLAHVTRFIASDYGSHVLAISESFKELNLRTMLNERQMLSGIIDRLYRNEAGMWEILDYKTDRTAVNKKKLDRYRFQMKFYAYLVSRYEPTPPTQINANLFFTALGAREQFHFAAADLSSVGKELNATVAKIRKDQEADSLEKIHRNYDHCPECPYYNDSDSTCVADGTLKKVQVKLRQDSLFQTEP